MKNFSRYSARKQMLTWSNAGLMLGQRRRRWPKIKPALCLLGAFVNNHEMLIQCQLHAGPAPQTLAQHQTSIVLISRGRWEPVSWPGSDSCQIRMLSAPWAVTRDAYPTLNQHRANVVLYFVHRSYWTKHVTTLGCPSLSWRHLVLDTWSRSWRNVSSTLSALHLFLTFFMTQLPASNQWWIPLSKVI